MKMRLGDTVMELDNIAYAKIFDGKVVRIYFVGTDKHLTVYCGEEKGLARYPGSPDELLNTIATLGRTAEELEHIAAMISNPNT